MSDGVFSVFDRLGMRLGYKIVYVMDFDGSVYKRWARPTPFGYTCKSLGIALLLLDDGTVVGPGWVESWKPA